MSITLHPTLGVNPHMTVYTKCGKDIGIAMIGTRTAILQCNQCGRKTIGHRQHEPCPECKSTFNFTKLGEVGEHDKLPGGLCDDCAKEAKEFAEIVSKGGVYFRCANCNATGVIKGHTKLAKAVRKAHKLPAPAPCGIEFENCAQHTPSTKA